MWYLITGGCSMACRVEHHPSHEAALKAARELMLLSEMEWSEGETRWVAFDEDGDVYDIEIGPVEVKG